MTKRFFYICDNCGRKTSMKDSEERFNQKKHHFCSKKCFDEYRAKHPQEFIKPKNLDMQYKLKNIAKHLNGITIEGYRIHLRDK